MYGLFSHTGMRYEAPLRYQYLKSTLDMHLDPPHWLIHWLHPWLSVRPTQHNYCNHSPKSKASRFPTLLHLTISLGALPVLPTPILLQDTPWERTPRHARNRRGGIVLLSSQDQPLDLRQILLLLLCNGIFSPTTRLPTTLQHVGTITLINLP